MNLYVTNIPQRVTKFQLRAFFEKIVSVLSLTMLEDGDALVGFETLEDANKALAELDGNVLGGKIISMRLALPRKERADSMDKFEMEDNS